MKYYTKDFYALRWIMYANSYVKKSKRAERFDEKFYKKCYDKRYSVFARHESGASWYIDPIKELKSIEEYANAPNLSDEERKLRATILEAHLYVNKERIKSGKFYKFDKELCALKFAEQQRDSIEIYSHLPEEIKDKIADMRVFALGYASAEVKRLLRPYCANLRRIYDDTTLKAEAETDDAEEFLTRQIGLKAFEEVKISYIQQRGNDICIKIDDCYLSFKNGQITEGQGTPVYKFNYKKPNCPWSLVLNTELHFYENKFEVNFLVNNYDEIDRPNLWYLTITCTDIIKSYKSRKNG